MIWFTLALFALSFFASVLLAPKPHLENARPGKLGDIQWPIADEGSPVPVIFGRVRLRSPNCIWYGDYRTRAVRKKVKTGVFSSEKVTTGYRYYVGFDLALCCGPDVKLKKIWVDKKLLYGSGAGIGPSETYFSINQHSIFGGSKRGGGFAGGCTFYGGQFPQNRNSYLEDYLDPDVPAYVGIAHIVFHRPYIGTSPQLHPLSFELERYPDNLGLDSGDRIIGYDLNPMEILYAAITEEWGGIGADPADIDTTSWIAAGATLADEGNGMSLLVSSANDGKSIVEEVLRQIDGILYQDPETGKIVIKLIREDYVIEDLPVFDESNIIQLTDFSRTSWSETINQVRVTFTYRNKKYGNAAALAQDMANINMQERIRSATISFPGCTEGPLACALSARELSQLSVPLFRATVRANREASVLRPGSPFVLNWPEYGIENAVMRVQRFDLGELLNGEIVMPCIQDKFAASNALYTIEDTAWEEIDRTVVDITDFVVFEAPYWILNQIDPDIFTYIADSAYFFGLARNPGLMQNYDFVTSNDVFANDVVVDCNLVEFTNTAKLNTAIAFEQGQSDGTIDKIVVKELDPDPSDFAGWWEEDEILYDTDVAGNRKGENLLLINGEFFAYETFTNNGDGTYDLETVHRALLDTQYEDHAVDDVVYFVNGIDSLSFNQRSDIATLYYKFLSYSDQDAQDIQDVAYGSIAANERYDRPLPPDLLEVDSIRCPIEIVGSSTVQITDYYQRNRTTPDEIVLVDDTSDSPEATTTYTIRFLLDGVELDEQTGLTYTGLPFSFTGLAGAGIARVEIEAVLDSKASWMPDFVEFWYAYYQNLGSELVTNGDFEASLSGTWVTIDGTWDTEQTVYPLEAIPTGTDHAEAKGTGDHELRQDVTVTAYQGQSAIFRVWKGALTDVVQSQIELELIQSPSTVLDSILTTLTTPTWGKWEMVEIPVPISSNTDIVRVTLHSDGPNAVFDNASLKVNTVATTSAVQYDGVTGMTVLGAWGLRRMVSTWSGALVRIRDTHDDSETDLGFDEDGNLELFHTVGEARVVRIYDQSGNGCHLDPITVGEQPRLRYGLSPTGRPYIKFTNGETLRDITSAGTSLPYMVARPNMSLVIGPRTTEGNDYIATIPHMDGAHSTPYYRWGLTTGSDDWRYRFDENNRTDVGNGDPDTTLSTFFADAQNGALYHNDDATAVDTWTPADTTYPNATRLRIAETATGTLPWDGDFYELCIFSGNIAAGDRQTVMEDLATYWHNLSI